jgi:hypothetical protein
MNVQHAPREMTASRKRHSSERGLWIALALVSLAIFFGSLPVYAAQLQTICTDPSGTACTYLQLTPEQAGMLKGIGLSLGAYATFMVALTLATVVVSVVVSTLIIWRRPDDRMALLVALALVTFGPITLASSVASSPSPWQVPNECLYILALTLFVLVFLLFPSGRFVPRWTRWTLAVFLVGQVPFTFFTTAPFTQNTGVAQVGYFLLLGEVALLAVVQLYRYRRVSSPLERQQTKWVVFGLAVPIIVFVGGTVLYLIFPVLAEAHSPYGAPYQLALNVISDGLVLLIPLSFGFAMLRSRLWDIDVLINRTLVYGTLTVLLALVYFGLIFGLQYLLLGIISQHNDVAIGVSTLVIAALFQPLRHRIQAIIDRRFYRQKYDATQIVETFSGFT